MPSCWAPREGRDEHIEELEKDNERLRAELKQAHAETDAAYHRETRLEAKIEAALALLGDECACDDYTGSGGCDFCKIREALRGGNDAE